MQYKDQVGAILGSSGGAALETCGELLSIQRRRLSAGGQTEQPDASAEASAGGGGGGGDPSQRLPQEAAEGAGRC